MILPREVTRDAITSTGEVPTKIRISPLPSIPLMDRVTIASVCGLFRRRLLGPLQRSLGLAAIALTRISQTPQFFVRLLKLFGALHILRFLLLIVASQLIEHFADGELVNFSHRELLWAWEKLPRAIR